MIPFIATAFGFWLTIIAACIYIVALAVIRYHIMNGKRLSLGKLHDHLIATGNPKRKKAEGKHPLLSSYLISVLVIFILTWQWQQMPIFYITVSILAIHDGLSAVIGRMWGRHEYPYSNKTFEGTFYTLMISLPVTILMAYLGCVLHGFAFFPVYIVLAISGCIIGAAIETFPVKNDNVVITFVVALTLLFFNWLLRGG